MIFKSSVARLIMMHNLIRVKERFKLLLALKVKNTWR